LMSGRPGRRQSCRDDGPRRSCCRGRRHRRLCRGDGRPSVVLPGGSGVRIGALLSPGEQCDGETEVPAGWARCPPGVVSGSDRGPLSWVLLPSWVGWRRRRGPPDQGDGRRRIGRLLDARRRSEDAPPGWGRSRRPRQRLWRDQAVDARRWQAAAAPAPKRLPRASMSGCDRNRRDSLATPSHEASIDD